MWAGSAIDHWLYCDTAGYKNHFAVNDGAEYLGVQDRVVAMLDGPLVETASVLMIQER